MTREYKVKLKATKDLKCKEIDASTKRKIIELAGNEVQQRNKTAKSSQLLLKN